MLATAVAGCLLAVTAYVHWQLGNYIVGTSRVLGIRLFLLLVAGTIGLCMAHVAGPGEAADTLFVLGFGMLHFPAALMLFARSRRRLGVTPSNAR